MGTHQAVASLRFRHDGAGVRPRGTKWGGRSCGRWRPAHQRGSGNAQTRCILNAQSSCLWERTRRHTSTPRCEKPAQARRRPNGATNLARSCTQRCRQRRGTKTGCPARPEAGGCWPKTGSHPGDRRTAGVHVQPATPHRKRARDATWRRRATAGRAGTQANLQTLPTQRQPVKLLDR